MTLEMKKGTKLITVTDIQLIAEQYTTLCRYILKFK